MCETFPVPEAATGPVSVLMSGPSIELSLLGHDLSFTDDPRYWLEFSTPPGPSLIPGFQCSCGLPIQ